jgi:hypothetical protein
MEVLWGVEKVSGVSQEKILSRLINSGLSVVSRLARISEKEGKKEFQKRSSYESMLVYKPSLRS